MTSRKIAALLTCVAVICGAAILWPAYKKKRRSGSLLWRPTYAPNGAMRTLNTASAICMPTAKDYRRTTPEAVRWLRRAADQGNEKAQYNLGWMYYRGQGVPQDYTEAFRWFRKAADRGDSAAQSTLTVSYFKGRGVRRNYTEAICWFGKVLASNFAKIERGPLARGTFVVGIVLALPVLVVPRRRWGRATWLPLTLVSAVLAAAIAHELSVLPLMPRGLLGTLSTSPVRVVLLTLIAGLSVMYAIGAVVEGRRGSKRGEDDGHSPAPPQLVG
jgi:Sel1 repeat-containing protein